MTRNEQNVLNFVIAAKTRPDKICFFLSMKLDGAFFAEERDRFLLFEDKYKFTTQVRVRHND